MLFAQIHQRRDLLGWHPSRLRAPSHPPASTRVSHSTVIRPLPLYDNLLSLSLQSNITPLHIAAYHGQTNTIALLLKTPRVNPLALWVGKAAM